MITVTPLLLETLAAGCDGQLSRVAEYWEDPDPWADPAYPLTLQAFLGGPDPAQRCGAWLAGDGPCRHYAIFAVTVGCQGEHMHTRPSCACCLGERLGLCQSGRLIACSEAGCWEHAMIGRYVPLYERMPS
jgi:hypothetical protein